MACYFTLSDGVSQLLLTDGVSKLIVSLICNAIVASPHYYMIHIARAT